MKNIKKLEIFHAAEDEFYSFVEDEKPLQLPKTLEHLNLTNIYFRHLNFLSDLHSLKMLILHKVAMLNCTLICIAENCLELHTLLLSCKNLSTFTFQFFYIDKYFTFFTVHSTSILSLSKFVYCFIFNIIV